MKKLGILFLGSILPSVAAAQAPRDTLPADTVIPLEPVVVSTVRAATTTGGSSALVVDPDSLHIAPAPTLEEALREIPFVAVRQNSRGQAEITVRGSDSRQVTVLLDGIPLTLGWDHRTDPSLVPITGARSITLVRGLHSVLYGPNVLGGVVEVGITEPADGAEPVAERPYHLALGADELGGVSASGVVRRSARTLDGRWTAKAGMGVRRRDAVAAPAGDGDTLSLAQGRRANSDLRSVDGFLSGRYDTADGRWLGFTASGYTARRGVPPELHVERPRLWRYPEESGVLAILSGGSGHRSTPWGRGDVEGSLGIGFGRQEIDRYASPAYEQRLPGESGLDRTVTVRLLGDHSTAGGGMVTGSATHADVWHREQPDEEESAVYRQRLWSLAAEIVQPLGQDARLSAGAALDGSDTPRSGGKPALGSLLAWGGRFGASTLLGESVRVHTAVSRRARFPSLRELYSGALGRFDPNPGLRPETLLGAEAGLTAHLGPAELQAVGFHHRLTDAVVRIVTPEGLFRRVNQDEIRSTGLELLADMGGDRWRLGGSVLVQDVALVHRSGAGEPRRPEHQPWMRSSAAAELGLVAGITAISSASFTSAQYCVHPDTGGYERLPAGGVVDLGLQRLWTRRTPVRLSAFLDNASDAAVYDQCGLPRPGRTLRFAVQVG